MDEEERGAPLPKAPQSQFEVTLRQPVQVELGQHPGHLVGTAHEQRQNTTLKALFQSRTRGRLTSMVPDINDTCRGLPCPLREPGVASTATVAGSASPQKLRHFLLQNPLQQIPDRDRAQVSKVANVAWTGLQIPG